MPAPTPSQRCAIYVRVSTRQQKLREQFAQLRKLAEARDYTVTHVYKERRSTLKERPADKMLMGDAAMRRFDFVLVWSIDRFGRSLVDSCAERLDVRGVKFVSLPEPAIDTTSAGGRLVLSVLAAAAEIERNRLRERTKMGVEAARRRGALLGRPPAKGWDEEKARAWAADGISAAEIGRRLDMNERTVRRHLAHSEKGTPLEAA